MDLEPWVAEKQERGAILLTKEFDWNEKDPSVFGLADKHVGWLEKADRVHLAVIHDGRVCTERGVVIGRENQLLGEVTPLSVPEHAEHSVFLRFRLPELNRKVKCAVAVFTDPINARNYCHYLFECASKLALHKEWIGWEEVDAVIVNEIALPFQKEIVGLAGIPEGKLVELRPDVHLLAKALYASSWQQFGVQPIPKWACETVRKLILPAARREGMKRWQPPRIVYISRRNYKRRRLVNEEEVMERLAGYGIEVVYLEEHSVLEQARIFHDAQVIVAPHGAGLANLVFCRKGTFVCEFRATFLSQYAMYGLLAAQNELEYRWLDCQVWKPERVRNAVDPELWVEPDSAMRMIEAALRTGTCEEGVT